jgi:hypothetical protein
VHHILATHPNLFSINEKTVCRHIAGGLPGAKNGDMPRVCMLRPRRKKPVEHKIDAKCRVGRSYADFKAFMAENPDTPVVEMDTLCGRVGAKCMLTLQFVNTGLMLAFVRERNDAQSVIDVFARILGALGGEDFRRLFPVILTDSAYPPRSPRKRVLKPPRHRGGSRRLPAHAHLLLRRRRTFRPCASWQKPHIGRNHEFLRLIRPKGSSFDDLSQDEVDNALAHVNSYARPSLGDKSPLVVFDFMYGAEVCAKLGLRLIPPNDIRLKPFMI